jgi:hypothetical protein
MNIALCLSGYVRSFSNTYNSLNTHVLAPYRPKIFIHTWDTTNKDGDTRLDAESLAAFYKPEAMLVENQDTVSTLFAPPKGLEAWGPISCTSKPMFYSIHQSSLLSQQQPTQWDLVIRCRFDLLFTGPLELDSAPCDRYIALPSRDALSVNDWFAYGSPAAMYNYAACFNSLDLYLSKGASSCNECLLAYHLRQFEDSIATSVRRISVELFR